MHDYANAVAPVCFSISYCALLLAMALLLLHYYAIAMLCYHTFNTCAITQIA